MIMVANLRLALFLSNLGVRTSGVARYPKRLVKKKPTNGAIWAGFYQFGGIRSTEPLYVLRLDEALGPVPVYSLDAWGGHPGSRGTESPKWPVKLDLTGFFRKFQSGNAKEARRSSAPRARTELKPALPGTLLKIDPSPLHKCKPHV
ncbi:hypothetical protein TNCV_1250611 [Trichonephila clavipes]|nr:hypothetical protein TNCV_1250611 [Trichonephila clavipes]